MKEYRLTRITKHEASLLGNPSHTTEDFAKIVLQYRPEVPDGYWEGRPYYFFGCTPDSPSAGYHVWWDVDPVFVFQKERVTIDDFLVDLGVELAIRGGIGAIIADSLDSKKETTMEDLWDQANEQKARVLLSHLPQKRLTGTWLNVAAGRGRAIQKVARESGIQRVLHLDPSWECRQRYIEDGGRARDYITLGVSEAERVIRRRNVQIEGIFLFNPPGGAGVIEDTFRLGRTVLQQPSNPLVMAYDTKDTHAVHAAMDMYQFYPLFETNKKGGKSAIFQRNISRAKREEDQYNRE